MSTPATTGVLRTNIHDMEIGDYISIRMSYGADKKITFSELGYPSDSFGMTLIGWAPGSWARVPLIKVAKGILVCDRVIAHSISWDDLNTQKLIQGQPWGTLGTIRSLTGGVAFADENGNKSTTDKGFGGWPQNNEWDSLICQFPQEKIQPGKTLDDVFHWSNLHSWVQDTPEINLGIATRRVARGMHSQSLVNHYLSSASSGNVGFRPVFQYRE